MSDQPHNVSAAQLDQLIALCDEIAALVRAGLPIEESLAATSREDQSKLGKHLAKLAEQLGMGQSLAEAIRNDPVFPPVYAAVAEAGVRSGNLAGALDSIAKSARMLRDCRTFLVRTALYPMVLFTMLWLVFTGLFLFVGPSFTGIFEAYHLTTPLFGAMQWAGGNIANALAAMISVPVILWGLFLFWCVRSAKGNLIQSAGRAGFFNWLPWLGRATKQMQKATFAQIFAMLVKSSLPLDQAILLAAKATSDRYWPRENLEQLQQRITAETTSENGIGKKNAYPKSAISPLIIWALGISNQTVLLEGLEQYANMARTRADLLIARCELILPGAVTFVFAVIIALCYFMTIIFPYTQILQVLSTFQG